MGRVASPDGAIVAGKTPRNALNERAMTSATSMSYDRRQTWIRQQSEGVDRRRQSWASAVRVSRLDSTCRSKPWIQVEHRKPSAEHVSRPSRGVAPGSGLNRNLG